MKDPDKLNASDQATVTPSETWLQRMAGGYPAETAVCLTVALSLAAIGILIGLCQALGILNQL